MATAPAGLSSQALAALASGVVALGAGGGAVCYSSHAVPGDVLYGVKTGISEPLNAAFAMTPSAKVKNTIDVADERLDEAQKLAVGGDLTAPVAQRLSVAFQNAVNKAQQKISVLSETNPELASLLAAELENSLNGQADLLASLGLHADAANQAALDALENAVRVEADAAEKVRVAVEKRAGGAGLEARAKALLTAATANVAEARAKVDSLKGSLDAAALADANAQLSAAQRALASGQAALNGNAFVQAADLLDASAQLAGQASAYADTMSDLKANGNLQADSVLNAARAKTGAAASGAANVTGSTAGSVTGSASGAASAGGSAAGAAVDSSGSGSASGSVTNNGGLLPDTGINIDDTGSVVKGGLGL